jgi:gliding motility-associated-like protein
MRFKMKFSVCKVYHILTPTIFLCFSNLMGQSTGIQNLNVFPEHLINSKKQIQGYEEKNLNPYPDLVNSPTSVVIGFNAPDTACVGQTITIENTTTGGTTYYWNFCSGNANYDPFGTNIGNFNNLLNVPTYITLVKDGSNCYSFISNQGLPGLVRFSHGMNFRNNPSGGVFLGNFGGLITTNMEGLQVEYDNGLWFGFIACDNTLIRLNFGADILNNSPVATNIGPFPVDVAQCFRVIKEGNSWIGFLSASYSNNLIRLNFGSTLENLPTVEDLGNLANFNIPGQFEILHKDNLWYLFILSSGNASLCRISFGNSLLNQPTGENLGNVGHLEGPGGLAIIQDCNSISGYFTKYQTPGLIGKLNFSGGITGTITGSIAGNIGDLSRPHTFSEIIREGDSLFCYVTNRGSYTLTRLYFPPCTNSSIPSSDQFTPPPFSYDKPGIYNIRLLVNEGQPDQVSLCKQITVLEKLPPVVTKMDTLLCFGVPYYAGGDWQTTPGIYYDTIHSLTDCTGDTVIKTTLNYKPEIPVNLGNDTTICFGWPYILHTKVPSAIYYWQDGTTDSIYAVSEPGKYWVTVTKDSCSKTDSIHFGECSSAIWFPNVFTPNGDGLNDTYHPVAIGISKFQILIFNRWGAKLYESNAIEPGWDGTFKGASCPDGVYVFISTYETDDSPDVTMQAQGSITLIR